MRTRRVVALIGLCAGVTASWAAACSVPVFRYAFEHWAADPYQAVVFHRGPLTPAQRALVRDLGPDGLAGRLHANLAPKTVDLDANPAPELIELLQPSAGERLPWVAVVNPRARHTPSAVWGGVLDAGNTARLIDSPARREIVQRLAEGQSAVWVLIESGDRDQDAAAAELLDARLSYLASTLALPKPDPQDIINGLLSVPPENLRLEFSILRLKRDDADEHPFLQILLGTEADLKGARQPIVIPVFGRGRALYALVGAGIKRETIDEAAIFLIGKCSCQVKEQNPGADLLFAADWEQLLKAQAAAIPSLPSLARLTNDAPATVTISGDDDASAQSGTTISRPALGMIAASVGLLIAALAGAAILWRRRR